MATSDCARVWSDYVFAAGTVPAPSLRFTAGLLHHTFLLHNVRNCVAKKHKKKSAIRRTKSAPRRPMGNMLVDRLACVRAGSAHHAQLHAAAHRAAPPPGRVPRCSHRFSRDWCSALSGVQAALRGKRGAGAAAPRRAHLHSLPALAGAASLGRLLRARLQKPLPAERQRRPLQQQPLRRIRRWLLALPPASALLLPGEVSSQPATRLAGSGNGLDRARWTRRPGRPR